MLLVETKGHRADTDRPARLRILVTGSRTWTDSTVIAAAFHEVTRRFPEYLTWDGWTIVHGAAPSGADKMADNWARVHLVEREPHPANWPEFGKSAGFRRNVEMVDAGASVCLAFVEACRKPHHDVILHGSHGAMHTVGLAQAAGIPVWMYAHGWTPEVDWLPEGTSVIVT